MKIREATAADLSQITALLKVCNLPSDDIDLSKQFFLVATQASEIIGTIALEIYGESALLRSFAVAESCRNQKMGERLYREALTLCKQKGIEHLFLLTTTADKYFERLGWNRIQRDSVPEALAATAEFASLCPFSSIVMKFNI